MHVAVIAGRVVYINSVMEWMLFKKKDRTGGILGTFPSKYSILYAFYPCIMLCPSAY